MSLDFTPTGNTYLVDFGAFRVELYFESATVLTYTGVRPDGSHGASETVSIEVTELRPELYLVRWQEQDKTTVVHVEDYANSTIITNITGPDLRFDQYKGTVTLLKSSSPS